MEEEVFMPTFYDQFGQYVKGQKRWLIPFWAQAILTPWRMIKSCHFGHFYD